MRHPSKVYKLCLGYGKVLKVSVKYLSWWKIKKFGTKILKISMCSTTFIRGTRVVKCGGLEKKVWFNNHVALNRENVGTKIFLKLISVPACLFGT